MEGDVRPEREMICNFNNSNVNVRLWRNQVAPKARPVIISTTTTAMNKIILLIGSGFIAGNVLARKFH